MERKTGLIERNFTLEAFEEIITQAGVVDFFRNKENFEFFYQEDQSCCLCEVRDYEGKRWFLYRLRDRRSDGPSFTGSPLTNWNYSGQYDVPPSDGLAVERSRYQGDPSFPLTNRFSPEVAEFIENPFEALIETKYGLNDWLNIWRLIFYDNDTVFPGQFSLASFPSNISKTLFNLTVTLLKENSYMYLTSIPTWWHVALSNLRQGFEFYYKKIKKYLRNCKKILEV